MVVFRKTCDRYDNLHQNCSVCSRPCVISLSKAMADKELCDKPSKGVPNDESCVTNFFIELQDLWEMCCMRKCGDVSYLINFE